MRKRGQLMRQSCYGPCVVFKNEAVATPLGDVAVKADFLLAATVLRQFVHGRVGGHCSTPCKRTTGGPWPVARSPQGGRG
jgi:hypothetical protein